MKERDIMRTLKINKVNTFLVGIMMMAILLCFSSQVQAAQSGDYTYSVTDGKVEITKYTGAGGVVTIPSTLAGFPVTSIGENAFQGCRGMTTISLPKGLTNIGFQAFNSCIGLTEINLPLGLTSIGSDAFSWCTGLTSINIPQGVTSIGGSAFYGCRKLTTINIPRGVTSIGSSAFSNCTSLVSITVESYNSNYSSIDGMLLNKAGTTLIACPGGLTSVSIPQGVTSIGDVAFSGCTKLTTINIPQGVTSIGRLAFRGCTGLTSITVASDNLNYSSIDGMLLNKAGTTLIACPTGLTSISIPQGVTDIGDYAFFGCDLTTINISQGVTRIGDYAFQYCYSLTNVSLSQELTSIGSQSFCYCEALTSISIPQGVTSIGDGAFWYCTGLTNINIPKGVTSIDNRAFYGCSGLTTIRFNSATTTIYDDADTIPAATKIIGYDPSSAKDYAVKYKRKFEVIGTTNTLQSIAITTPATKLTYSIGDKLDISGLVITGTYSDGSTKVESITAANIKGFNSSKAATNQVLTITVGAKTTTYKVQIVAAPIPPVTGVSLKAISSGEIDLNWDMVNGAKSYNIYQSTSENGKYTKVGSAKKTTSFKNTKLKPSTSYWYKVTAVTTAGESEFSNIKTATTLPLTPSGVKAKAVSSTAVTLTWKAIVGSTFNVFRSTTQKGDYTKIAEGLNASMYRDISLTPKTTYWYKVTAIDASGNESVASTPVKGLTKAR